MQVLFVEDDPMNRRVVKDMLSVVGAQMSEAPDAETGLRMIDDGHYQIVLMDLRMPGMDGLTAIRHLRARTDHKAQLPVIVVTADTADDLRELIATFLGAPLAAATVSECATRPSSSSSQFEGALQGQNFALGHRVRDGLVPPPSHTRRVPIVIVGAGIAGLSAAWRLTRAGELDYTILELEPADARGDARQVVIDDRRGEADGLEQARAAVAVDRADAHLGHDPLERLLEPGDQVLDRAMGRAHRV